MVSDLSPSHVQPLRRVPASQQLHDLLRDRIIALELAPGAALSRNDLADRYRSSAICDSRSSPK